MEFTYQAYEELLGSLKKRGYAFADYHDWENYPRCVILRHDIDNDIEKALALAELEIDKGVKSTYFVLVTSDFYNVYSAESERLLRRIMECGHEIGLHFDEKRYPEFSGAEDAVEKIVEEAALLGKIIGGPVTTVSMHRPSRMMLGADLQIPGMINSYGQVFFKEFKYVSDSRKRWREPVCEIVLGEQYERLHILTHAFWYNEDNISIHDSIYNFVNAGNRRRFILERENITDLSSIMTESEIKE